MKRARWSLGLWITLSAFLTLAVFVPASVAAGHRAWGGSGATSVQVSR